MRLSDIVKFKPSQWLTIGEKTITRIILDTGKGIGQNGRKFPSYSKNYAELKAAGKAGDKGVGTDRQISPPNLRLSGEMLGSIHAGSPTKESVKIFFGQGGKVERNKKHGRDILGISDKNLSLASKDILAIINRKANRWAAKDINLVVGR